MNKSAMADRDIPIANAIPVPPINPAALDGTMGTGGGGRGRSRSPTISLPTTATAPAVTMDHHSGSPLTTTVDPERLERIDMLRKQGYTRGLAESLDQSKQAFPLSIWIVDNSGSMQHVDGHRIIQKQNQLKLVECTRWAEMQQTVEYHAMMAAQLQSPTVFRLLNDPGRGVGEQQFSIAKRGTALIEEDVHIARRTMEHASPGGVTPLIPHMQEIRNNLLALETELRNNGTKVVLVLATDGLPTSDRGIFDDSVRQQFVESLRALEGLPIWIVVRLCTDDDDVVQFWNSLDGQLELNLDVLDDFVSEAKEVHEHNPWINYGLPLHRMREMGVHHRLFDLLDERPLSKDELRDFARLLLGDGVMDGVPHPEENWRGFYNHVSKLVAAEHKTWNPITRHSEPWIDLHRLSKDYGDGGGGWFSFF